jgi:hypothetical protein
MNTSPGGDTGPGGRKRARFALALGAGAFALVFAITSGAGPGLGPDAMAYLGATTSLVQHGTLRVPSSQWDAADSTSALTTWPPAFSIAMAVPRALGAGSLLSARIVNALAAFVTAAVLFLLFEGAAGTLAAVSGVVVVFVTTAVVGVHLSVLSEPLFLASLVLTLWAMVSTQRPLTAGIPAALAAMVRYAGVCAPTAVVLWFFFRGRKSLHTRFADAAQAAIIPAVVIAGWLARNMRVGDNSGAPELGLNGNFGLTFREATQTFADWLAPGMHPPTLQLIVALTLAAGLTVVARNGVRHSSERARFVLKADLLLLFCYVLVLMSARVLVGSAIPFDFRLLVPAILLAEIAITVTLAGYVAGAGRAARRIAITACALWLVASATQDASDVSEAVTDGSDFASSDWRSSPTLDWVRSRSAGWTLFSNWPPAIYFGTSRIARDIPQSLDTSDLREFGETLERSHGALVAFSSGNPDYPPGDSIAHALGLVKAGQFSDGTVWVTSGAPSR